MIQRILAETILKNLKTGFITIIYGPRRVGKTVLLSQILEKFPQERKLVLNGDTLEARETLNTTSEVKLSGLVENYEIIAVDEAQRIPNIALALKIIIDKFPDKKIFITGSASLELAKGIPEELTGRTGIFRLYPLATAELTQALPSYQKRYLLEEQLIFGGYPYLVSLALSQQKAHYLTKLAKDYLLRDLLRLKEVGSPEILKKLATLLAFQIGSEVSLNELSLNLQIDVKTVARYLELLKLGFLIFEVGAFSKNLRKEVAKSKKYYFWDLGIRNALLGQFLALNERSDVGALWENFLAVERLKKHEYFQKLVNTYFWRTYQKAEIDWIELENGNLWAYEFKWKERKVRTPKAFKDAYGVEVQLITPENYLEFVDN